MKIISGKYKGRTLEGYQLEGTRPTMDRVKESLFAMLQDKIPNSVVLDLFSGSGNLGIEALSNGANTAYLVDHNRKAKETIEKNIKKINIENVYVYEMDYVKALEMFDKKRITFDCIFLDPPYKTNYIEKSIELIDQYQLLNEEGIIICESDDPNLIIYSKEYEVVKERKYGEKIIVLLKKI